MTARHAPPDEREINPPHNAIDHEKFERERMRLYWYHKRADTLETYYHIYPEDRPLGRTQGGRDR